MDFSSDQTWKNYDQKGLITVRLNTLRELIPSSTTSILDVGCGNGIITNDLANDYDVTGIDPSAAALKYVKCAKQRASITEIPFPDKSFDLVCCNEVLEHLEQPDLVKGIRELKRVARECLLISVPNHEQLEMKQYRCALCGHTAHVHGHIQSFNSVRLRDLFSPECFIIKQRVCGVPEREFAHRLLKWKHDLGQWFEPEPGYSCPRCGSAKFSNHQSLLTKAINGLNLVISKPRPYWYMALFQIRNG